LESFEESTEKLVLRNVKKLKKVNKNSKEKMFLV